MGPVAAEEAPSGDDALPFADLKVADFAWVGVGPITSKYLADHGATVVRVESENRPDVLRGAPPFKDDVPGINRSQFFGDFNTSKLGLALDLTQDDAIAVAKRLIAWSDVMIESFTPGAVQRMGLDYERMREINPGLVMVSTCLMGQTGPARKDERVRLPRRRHRGLLRGDRLAGPGAERALDRLHRHDRSRVSSRPCSRQRWIAGVVRAKAATSTWRSWRRHCTSSARRSWTTRSTGVP